MREEPKKYVGIDDFVLPLESEKKLIMEFMGLSDKERIDRLLGGIENRCVECGHFVEFNDLQKAVKGYYCSKCRKYFHF